MVKRLFVNEEPRNGYGNCRVAGHSVNYGSNKRGEPLKERRIRVLNYDTENKIDYFVDHRGMCIEVDQLYEEYEESREKIPKGKGKIPKGIWIKIRGRWLPDEKAFRGLEVERRDEKGIRETYVRSTDGIWRKYCDFVKNQVEHSIERGFGTISWPTPFSEVSLDQYLEFLEFKKPFGYLPKSKR